MKPCPFCGSSRVEVYCCKNGDARIRCECGVIGPAGHGHYFLHNADTARQLWDERALEPAWHVSSDDLKKAGVGK